MNGLERLGRSVYDVSFSVNNAKLGGEIFGNLFFEIPTAIYKY